MLPPRPENAKQAVETLRAELTLATGDADSIDRKASLIPVVLAAITAFSLGDFETTYTYDQHAFLTAALGSGFLAVIGAVWTLIPGQRSVGPDADAVLSGLSLHEVDFDIRIAASLRDAVNDQTQRNIDRSGRLALAILPTAATIVLLIGARFVG